MYYQYWFVNQHLIERKYDRFVLIVEDVEIEHEKPRKEKFGICCDMIFMIYLI